MGMTKEIKMKYYILNIIILILPLLMTGQTVDMQLEGQVTFKSSKNIYIKFNTTEDINRGDTLSIVAQGVLIPSLKVSQKSSSSCVAENFSENIISVGDKVFFFRKQKKDKLIKTVEEKQLVITTPVVTPDSTHDDTLKVIKRKEMISVRLSISTNADLFPDGGNNYQRLRTGLSFNILNIRQSSFSVFSYMTYRHRYGIDQQQTDFFNDFKIFTFAAQYDPGEKFNIVVGRKINQNISNIGSIDGLQGELRINKYVMGLFAGSRPDLSDYSFNFNLPQFGVYLVRNDKLKNGIASTTLAIAEQMKDFKTDRRFAYFQHNNSLIKNLNVFFSSEIDLYEKIDSQASGKLSLTSLYFSARYRILKNLSFSASYDNRRNVIYYESYQTFIDQLLAQETRQGLRFQVNFSPLRSISLNASAFLRYQGDNPKPTTNYVCNLSFNKIPLHNISLSLTGNLLESVYFKGTIIGGRISDNFFKGKLNAELNYRNVNYSFYNSESNLKQNIAGINLSLNIMKRTSLMVSYEGTFDKTNSDYHRYYVTINQRFKN